MSTVMPASPRGGHVPPLRASKRKGMGVPEGSGGHRRSRNWACVSSETPPGLALIPALPRSGIAGTS